MILMDEIYNILEDEDFDANEITNWETSYADEIEFKSKLKNIKKLVV